jgi:hypothetical protein
MGYILDNDSTSDDSAAFDGKRKEGNVASLELLEVRDNARNMSHTSCNSFVDTFEVVNATWWTTWALSSRDEDDLFFLDRSIAVECREEDSEEDFDQEQQH